MTFYLMEWLPIIYLGEFQSAYLVVFRWTDSITTQPSGSMVQARMWLVHRVGLGEPMLASGSSSETSVKTPTVSVECVPSGIVVPMFTLPNPICVLHEDIGPYSIQASKLK